MTGSAPSSVLQSRSLPNLTSFTHGNGNRRTAGTGRTVFSILGMCPELRHRRCVVSALIYRWFVFSAYVVGVAFIGISSASASTTPAIVRGSILSYATTNAAGYGGDIAYGTPMKFEIMTIGVPNPESVSCHGQRCFALGSAGSFEYPAVSSDHGRTWRNGGHWFAGAWADAAAFASRMTVLSATNAVAWVSAQNTGFYSTSTAGRTWYAVHWPGNITRVTGSSTGEVITVTIVGFNSKPSGQSFRYSSRDGGLIWNLDH